jgi:hypothetical protein
LNKIGFHNHEQFLAFLKQVASPVPALLETEQSTSTPGYYRNNTDSKAIKYKCFTALTKFNGYDMTVVLDAQPDSGPEWSHTIDEVTGKRALVHAASAKNAFVKTLRGLKIEGPQMDVFKRVTKKTVQEMVDASTEDTDETTYRVTRDGNTDFDLTATDGKVVRVKFVKDGNSIIYRAIVDNEAAWAPVDAGAAVVRGTHVVFVGELTT